MNLPPPPTSELPAVPQLPPELSLLLDVTHLAARATEKTVLFSRACELSVERLGLRFAWVGLLHDDARVDPVARAGEDGGYIDSIEANALLSSDHGRGPTGEALRSGHLSLSADFLHDPATAPWHEAAARVGVGSSLVLPLRQSGRVVASMNLYGPRAGFFDDALVSVARRLADELSFGLDTVARHEERRHIQRELERAASRWRFALEGAEHGVWEWDATTDKVFYSRAWKSMLGFADHEIGDSLDEWRNRVHPDDLPAALEAIERHFSGVEPVYRNEHRLRCKDGSYKWILDQGKVLARDAAGKPTLVVGTHTDIHERKLEAERLRLALEAGQLGIYDLNVQTGEAQVTPEYASVLGYDPATFRETNAAWIERLHPDDKERCAKVYRDYVEGRRPDYRVEFRQRTASGGWKWILSYGRLIERDAAGRPLRMLGTHTDIDPLKRLETTLRQAEAIAHVGAWEWDVASGRQWWSEETFRIFGLDPEPQAPELARGLGHVHPDDRASVERALGDAAAGRTPEYFVEFRGVRPDGVVRFVTARGQVERNDRGEAVRMVGTIFDVTELRKHERALSAQRRRAEALLQLAEAARSEGETSIARKGLSFAEELTGSAASFAQFVTADGFPAGAPVWSPRALAGPVSTEELARAVADALVEAKIVRNPRVADLPAAVPVGIQGFARTVLVPVIEGEHVHMVLGVAGKPADYDDQDVETVRLLGESLWNIVVRRRAEEELARSEERYRQLFESNPHPMWVYDTGTLRFLAVNDAAVAHYGWAREAFLALTLADIHPPEDVPRLLAAADPARRESDRAGYWRHRTKDGRVIDVEITGHRLVFDGHDAELVLANDVTERLAADRARLDAEEKFRAIAEQSLVGIYVNDHGRFAYVNPRGAALVGAQPSELLGEPVSVVFAPEELPRVVERQRKRDAGEEVEPEFVFKARHREGRTVVLSLTSSPMRLAGRVLSVGVIQDVTAKVEAEQRAEEFIERLQRASQATLGAVSAMMDMRDPYTAGHERRVGELAAAIAAEMGLPEERQLGLRFSGLVHDVGKIAVPAEILTKPTRLTKAEYELIKTHAQVGFDILKDVDFPWPVAQVAFQHHERIDGTGYPRGLKGDEILLEARITAVADVVESMASHRPYRPSRGINVALEEIEQNAGKIYDPVAAAACLRLFREKGYVLPA